MEDTLQVMLPPVGSTVIYRWYYSGETFEAPAIITSHPLDGKGNPQSNAAINVWVLADPTIALKGGMATPVVHRHAVPHITQAKHDHPSWSYKD